MAKFRYVTDFESFGFDIDLLELKIRSKGEKAVWTDSESGVQVIFTGTGFKAGARIRMC